MSGKVSMVLRKVGNFGCSLWEIEKKWGRNFATKCGDDGVEM
jgi:hypothetical protein